jgi:hypothetical protein
MDIVNTYLELGTYRGAGDLCGVDHKTAKWVVQRWRAGTTAEPRATPTRARNTDCVDDLIWDKVRKTRGRITAKRLLPQARAAGYEGSARNFRRAMARAKARWARSQHNRRPWVPTPGEHLVIDWGEEGPAQDLLRGAGVEPLSFRALRHRHEAGNDAAGPGRVHRGARCGPARSAVRSHVMPASPDRRQRRGPASRLRSLRHPLLLPSRLLRGR